MAKNRRLKLVDNRQLPPTYDPDMFYRYAITAAMEGSNGVEFLLYKVMPYSLIRSFAIAIDPFSRVRPLAYGKVTPANRNVWRNSLSVLDARIQKTVTYTTPAGTIPNWNNIPGRNSPFIRVGTTTKAEYSSFIDRQDQLSNARADSTWRLRYVGSDISEFSMQKASVYSPPRRVTYRVKQFDGVHINAAPDNDQISITEWVYEANVTRAANISSTNFSTFRNNELALGKKLIKDNVVQLYNQAMPSRKRYTLFRNIVELRDLPRSVLSLRKTAADLAELWRSLRGSSFSHVLHDFKTTASNIPDEYLSYMFGWRQLYSDVVGLLQAPDRITKDINFMMSRGPKESLLRAQKKVSLPYSASPSGFTYWPFSSYEAESSQRTEVQREAVIRIVLSTNFEFPNLMLPNFQKDLFLRKLGVYPSVTDLYNLVPWTWLYDWFTGAGNYLDAIEQINSDNKLVNWGLVTVDLRSTLTTTYRYRPKPNISRVNWTGSSPSSTTDTDIQDICYHSSGVELKTVVRNDILTAMSGVRSTSDTSSLSTYQKSILGALLWQRTKNSKR